MNPPGSSALEGGAIEGGAARFEVCGAPTGRRTVVEGVLRSGMIVDTVDPRLYESMSYVLRFEG